MSGNFYPTPPHASSNGSLHHRLAEIAGKVGAIKATGKTPQGVKALSIANVEDALRPLFIEHRVLTGFRWNDKPMPLERVSIKINEKTGEVRESKYYEWLADLTVWMVNADDGTDRIEDRTCDIGSSPSAAVSFALKRYYRALFHLADEDDEHPGQTTRKPVQTARPAVKSSGAEISPTGSSPSGTSPRSLNSAPDTRSGAGAGASPLPRPGAGHEAQAPPAASAPDSSSVPSKAVSFSRLSELRPQAGLSHADFMERARHITGNEKLRDLTELTAEQAHELVGEVEGLVLSTSGASA